MSKIKSVVAFCALMMVAVLMSACGGGGSSESNLVGRWYQGVRFIEFFSDGTAYTESLGSSLGFDQRGFSNANHLTWQTQGGELSLVYERVKTDNFIIRENIQGRFFLTIESLDEWHRPNTDFIDRSGVTGGIEGHWAEHPGRAPHAYLEFWSDGAGQQRFIMAFHQTWEPFTWTANEDTVVRTYNVEIEYYFEIDGDELVFSSIHDGNEFLRLTRGQATPANQRVVRQTPQPPLAAALPTPAPDVAETPTPPIQHEPPPDIGVGEGVYTPMGRWEMVDWFRDGADAAFLDRVRAHGTELRFFEGGRGLLLGGGVLRDIVFTLRENDGMFEIWFFDGSMGYRHYQLSYNPFASGIFLDDLHLNSVLFAPAARQTAPSPSLNELLHGKWGCFFGTGMTGLEIEFLPDYTGRWTDDFGVRTFEWILDEDILLFIGTEYDDEPFNMIVFNPFSEGGAFLTLARTLRASELIRTSGTGGLVGSWRWDSSNVVAYQFNSDYTGIGDFGLGEEVSFTWKDLDGVLIIEAYLEWVGEYIHSVYKYRLVDERLYLYPITYLLSRQE